MTEDETRVLKELERMQQLLYGTSPVGSEVFSDNQKECILTRYSNKRREVVWYAKKSMATGFIAFRSTNGEDRLDTVARSVAAFLKFSSDVPAPFIDAKALRQRGQPIRVERVREEP